MNEKSLLTDEELDMVTGGTILETMQNYKTFKSWNLVPGEGGFSPNAVRNTFKQFGVRMQDYGGLKNNNEYFIGNKKVSMQEALDHVHNQLNN